jgi:hypothetical protein
MRRKCSVCGTSFEQTRAAGRAWRYCSDECRRAAERERVARFRAAHPDRARAQSRESSRRSRARQRAQRPDQVDVECIECGETFARPFTSRRLICSRKCRNRRSRSQRDPAARAEERARYRAWRRHRDAEAMRTTTNRAETRRRKDNP